MRTRPQFEILWEPRLGVWADDLAALFARTCGAPQVWSLRAFRSDGFALGLVWVKRGRGLLASLFVHACAFALLSHASLAARVNPPAAREVADNSPPIYLDLKALKELKILRALPVVKPTGPGGRPGIVARPPLLKIAPEIPEASTAQSAKFTIVVNPLKPENRTQAIRQPLAPPDLKIRSEQQLPDIVLDDEPGPAAPKPKVDLELQRPTVLDGAANAKALPAPAITSNAPQLAMKLDSSVPQPKMPASYFASDALRAPHQATTDAAGARKGARSDAPANAPGGVVVLSAQPAAFSQLAALAQGNRLGALAIAPSKSGLGSPGGKPNAAPAPGANGAGAGGDTSSGVGPGISGGGGGAAEISARANFSAVGGSGKTGGMDANGLLAPVLPAAVFPVVIAPNLRRAPLVISAGPIGGGGLDVYGALKCGKVYSIFLPMPGKNWALQYCAHEAGPAAAAKPAQPSSGVVRLEAGIVPPAPEKQFDFRRLPVPDNDSDKLIILQGMIGADGTVSGARVFRGVLPEMDAAAAQAFSNWKFKPATRAGTAVALDVLVGIPAKLPQKTNAASTASSPDVGN